MNRRSFIKTTIASGAALATGPGPAGAAGQTGSTLKDGLHVPAGKDRGSKPLHLGTDRVDAKVSTDDSNGGLYVVEGTKVGKGGPPRHVHHEQDEWFYVLEGEFRFDSVSRSSPPSPAIPSSGRERSPTSGLASARTGG